MVVSVRLESLVKNRHSPIGHTSSESSVWLSHLTYWHPHQPLLGRVATWVAARGERCRFAIAATASHRYSCSSVFL